MLVRAQSDLQLDMKSSILIGDKVSDIEAGLAAGVGTTILLSVDRLAPESQTSNCYEFSSLDDIRQNFFSSGLLPRPKIEAHSYTLNSSSHL